MSLKKYHEKRDFRKTAEPRGKKLNQKQTATKTIKKMPLHYLIQKHDASHLHYDLRLEMNGVLKSWAVPKGPSLDSKVKRLAVEVEDHPLEYGNFEGIIPKGQYGGGTVMLWDKGHYQSINDPLASLKKGDLTFEIKGKKLKGLWKLIRMRQKLGHENSISSVNQSDKKTFKRTSSQNKNYWLLFKMPDKYEKEDYDITDKKQLSVTTKRNLDEIAHDSLKKKKFIWNSAK